MRKWEYISLSAFSCFKVNIQGIQKCRQCCDFNDMPNIVLQHPSTIHASQKVTVE